MAVVPAGWSLTSAPLTCTESAIAHGLDEWARNNIRWRNAMTARNVCFGLFFGFLAFSLISLAWLFFAIISAVIGTLLHFLVHPRPLKFPDVAITTHGWAKFGPVNHLVSNSVSQGFDLSVFSKVLPRNLHDPQDHIESNQLRLCSNDNTLSLSSLQALVDSDSNYMDAVSKTKIHDFRLTVLNSQSTTNFGDFIVSDFPSSSSNNFQAALRGVRVTEMDVDSVRQAQQQIDWFIDVNQYNEQIFGHIRSALVSERTPYGVWSNDLHEAGNNRSKIVLDSTQQGWENSTHGVDSAEDALERSVAAEIIAQKEAVHRDMERTEEQIREKEAEFGIENARQQEQLEIELNEIDAQVRVVNRQVSKIESLPIDSTIEMMTAYGVTSGGGGNFAVTSTVRREHYKIPNPAWSTREAIVELANTEKDLLVEKQKYVKVKIQNLDGAKERMMQNLIEKKNERLERLEESKNRAMKAIRKDANEVRSLEESNVQTNRLLRETVESFWLQSHRVVNDSVTRLESISSEINEIFTRIKSANDLTINILRQSSISQHGGVPLLQHWLIINGKPYSDARSVRPIGFTNTQKMSINQGLSSEVLGVGLGNMIVQPLPRGSFTPGLSRLNELGVIDPKFYNTVSRLKLEHIMGV